MISLDFLPSVFTSTTMRRLEEAGDAEILKKEAAEEEHELTFPEVRTGQLVAKVTVTKYYKHTQFGYEEIRHPANGRKP